ncbi:hypothetical protein BH09BAC1_BH09BAC1_07580 [soil metagenome]
MKFLFSLLLAFSVFSVGYAQKVEVCGSSCANGIGSDGYIKKGSSSVGKIESDGTIENTSNSTLGYIKSNGTIENSSHSTVGYVKSDGTIENSSHSTIGYVKSDGTVENSSHSTIGKVSGVKKEWVAVAFFFFKP